MKWSELSMTEKNEVIKMAVAQGIRDIPSIKNLYEESVNGSRRFKDGGGLSSLPSNWTMQDEAKYRNWRENLPVNLRNTNDNDYDMRRAYLAGMQPHLEDDGYYHLGSRDSKTGRILKAPHHPTYLQAINTDARIGYYPTLDKQGVTYTDTWEGNKYELGGPKRDRMPAHPRRGNEEKDPEAIAAYQQYESDMAERRKVSAERAKQFTEEKARRNIEAAKEFNRRKDVVMSQLEDEASSIPFTGQEIQQATEEQRQEKLDKWRDYKKGINATITAAELGLSGASLLGAYANWKNWATAANATKRGIANLLQRAQLPMQVTGTAIDGYQTYDANSGGNDFDTYYNGAGTALGVAGSLGAADLFNPKVDRVLDVLGIIQNSGDFLKFGYDSMFGNEKAEGGSIHIAPSKRGTFTAAATKHGKSVQEFASQVLSHPENYSLTMRKKANFARNASKWKH